MTEPPNHSPDTLTHPAALLAADLLRYYNFELEQYAIAPQIAEWLAQYPAKWIQLAVVEALYQGRYKVISVDQILALWQRRSQPINRFTGDFERLVCNKIPRTTPPPQPDPEPVQASPSPRTGLSYRKMLLELPSVASRLDRLPEIPTLQFTPPPDPAQPEVVESPSGSFTAESPLKKLESLPLSNGNQEYKGNGKLPVSFAQGQEFKKFKEGALFALSSGLASSTLHPKLRLALSQHYIINWQQFDVATADTIEPSLKATS
jgi:hypothetical protein